MTGGLYWRTRANLRPTIMAVRGGSDAGASQSGCARMQRASGRRRDLRPPLRRLPPPARLCSRVCGHRRATSERIEFRRWQVSSFHPVLTTVASQRDREPMARPPRRYPDSSDFARTHDVHIGWEGSHLFGSGPRLCGRRRGGHPWCSAPTSSPGGLGSVAVLSPSGRHRQRDPEPTIECRPRSIVATADYAAASASSTAATAASSGSCSQSRTTRNPAARSAVSVSASRR